MRDPTEQKNFCCHLFKYFLVPSSEQFQYNQHCPTENGQGCPLEMQSLLYHHLCITDNPKHSQDLG